MQKSEVEHEPASDVQPERIGAAVPDGAKLVVAQDNCGVAMAATRELVRRGVRGLHLVCVPISGCRPRS